MGDTVYVTAESGHVAAFDRADGTERWRFETDTPIPGAPAVANGTVYVADEAGVVYALSSFPRDR